MVHFKNFMVCEKRDCNLQSIKITFSSVHCHNVGTADSATVFRFAQSQNKKCKLKFIEKLEDDAKELRKDSKKCLICLKIFSTLFSKHCWMTPCLATMQSNHDMPPYRHVTSREEETEIL